MGIKSFNDLLTENCQGKIPFRELYGKKVAVDGNNLAYIEMAIANKTIIGKTQVAINDPDPVAIRDLWFERVLRFLEKSFLIHQIYPVFIMDGRPHPEKLKTITDRSDKRDDLKSQIEDLKSQVRGQDPLDIPSNLIETLKKKMAQQTTLTFEDYSQLQLILEAHGIRVLRAKHDAEQLASMLCQEGKVHAVFSTDTDNYAYGTPLLITRVLTDGFQSVSLDNVIAELGLESHEQLKELCIMCGTDFNSNIFRVGPKNSLKLIKEFKSIDSLPEKYRFKDGMEEKKTVNVLRASVVREIFKCCSSQSVCQTEVSVDPLAFDFIEGQDLINSLGIKTNFVSKFYQLISSITFDDSFTI